MSTPCSYLDWAFDFTGRSLPCPILKRVAAILSIVTPMLYWPYQHRPPTSSSRLQQKKNEKPRPKSVVVSHSPLSSAVRTGLEPATPGVTGLYSNQLNYRTFFSRRSRLLWECLGLIARLRVQSYDQVFICANILATFFQKNAFFAFICP